MSMKLTSLWFFCNRPTVGALIGFGTDLAAATNAPDSARDPIPSEVCAPVSLRFAMLQLQV